MVQCRDGIHLGGEIWWLDFSPCEVTDHHAPEADSGLVNHALGLPGRSETDSVDRLAQLCNLWPDMRLPTSDTVPDGLRPAGS